MMTRTPTRIMSVLQLIFLSCALLGGVLFLGQFLLSVIGIGDHDTGDAHVDTAHADTSMLFSLVSFRSIVAALTVFGLVGMATKAAGWPDWLDLLVASASGLTAMIAVALIMRSMTRLNADGTIIIQDAVGKSATVYLTVPAKNGGFGKITVTLQNRTVELRASTAAEADIATGKVVTIKRFIGADTAEVEPLA